VTGAAKHFDAIIIGTGQAGPPMVARFAGAGKTVAIIECGKFGGTFMNTGCTPTKALVASASAIHLARQGAEFGFSSGDVRVDFKRVKARKDAASAASSKGVEEWLRGMNNCTVIQSIISRKADTKVSTILSSNCSSPRLLF